MSEKIIEAFCINNCIRNGDPLCGLSVGVKYYLNNDNNNVYRIYKCKEDLYNTNMCLYWILKEDIPNHFVTIDVERDNKIKKILSENE